ncbi:MAG: YggT family protein [Clostridia bacterium]|nr:YggT family protein [Clostridia bacterium]
MLTLVGLISILLQILTWVVIIECFLSFFVRGSQSDFVIKLYMTLNKITEPMCRPFRDLLSRFYNGPIDFSPLLVIVAIELVRKILMYLLLMF